MITFYELSGKNNLVFSSYCWRVRLALMHKGLDYQSIKVGFTQIKEICNANYKTVPILQDGEFSLNESFAIVDYLEKTYVNHPSLLRNTEGRTLSKFIEMWSNSLHADITQIAIADIYDCVQDFDRGYFRQSREYVFGDTLENYQQKNQAIARINLRNKLAVLEKHLEQSEYIGGDAPFYPDFIVFGTLQWLILTSKTFTVEELGNHIGSWFLRIGEKYLIAQ